MKLFLAGSSSTDMMPLIELEYPFYLLSYHYFKTGNKWMEKVKTLDNHEIFIDSGAFSSDSIGVKINIDDYITHIKTNDFKYYAVLDDLSSASRTHENQLYMESKGLRPIPCFHMGDSIEWLDIYLDYDYIALGGMVKNQNVEAWLDAVWNHIIKKRKDIKVHGFGMTSSDLMVKYPWYSVDSSSYSSGTRFARVYQFHDIHKYVYDISVHEFAKSQGIHWVPGQSITGAFRMEVLKESARAFIKLCEWVNNKVDNKDFNHLAGQSTILDSEMEIYSPDWGIDINQSHPIVIDKPEEIPDESDNQSGQLSLF